MKRNVAVERYVDRSERVAAQLWPLTIAHEGHDEAERKFKNAKGKHSAVVELMESSGLPADSAAVTQAARDVAVAAAELDQAASMLEAVRLDALRLAGEKLQDQHEVMRWVLERSGSLVVAEVAVVLAQEGVEIAATADRLGSEAEYARDWEDEQDGQRGRDEAEAWAVAGVAGRQLTDSAVDASRVLRRAEPEPSSSTLARARRGVRNPRLYLAGLSLVASTLAGVTAAAAVLVTFAAGWVVLNAPLVREDLWVLGGFMAVASLVLPLAGCAMGSRYSFRDAAGVAVCLLAACCAVVGQILLPALLVAAYSVLSWAGRRLRAAVLRRDAAYKARGGGAWLSQEHWGWRRRSWAEWGGSHV